MATARRAPRARQVVMNEARAAKAISHPLRKEILERMDGVITSPSDLADRVLIMHEDGKKPKRKKVKGLGPIGNVSYHTRILLRVGAIKLVETKQVRGAIEHFYTASVRIKPMSWEEIE